MASDEPASRRKHRRSPDEGTDEGSKRRKHHHSHHRHHKSHRHRSKREKHEEDGDLPVPVAVANLASQPDDDKEEGEILEEGEVAEYYGGVGDGSKKKHDSDVESGEIKPDEGEDDRLTIHGEGDASRHKGSKEFKLNLPVNDGIDEDIENRNEDITLNSSLDAGNDKVKDGKLNPPNDFVVDGTERFDNEGRESPLKDGSLKNHQAEVDESRKEICIDVLNVEFKSSRSRKEMQISLDDSVYNKSGPSDASDVGINGGLGRKLNKGDLRRAGSESPLEGKRLEKIHKDVGSRKRHTKSISPVAREILNSLKQREKGEHGGAADTSRNVEKASERNKSRKHSDLIDGNRYSLTDKDRSVSPQNLRDKYKTGRSPSYDRNRGEAHNRNHSRSCDARERISLSTDDAMQNGFQQTAHSWEHNAKSYADDCDRKKSSHSRESTKTVLDRERVARYDEEDQHHSRGRLRDMEIDRAIHWQRESSYSRHGGRGDRHSSRDRDRDRDRDIYKERAGGTSYSLGSGREDRHSSRDREKERNMERDREREKGRDRNREKEREKEHESSRDKERVRDRDRESDRISSRDRYKDSRHSRYDEVERNRGKTRPNGSSNTEPDLENKNDKPTREEDGQEDYLEQIELKLSEQEEEDIDRIKEESRKRREAILEKYKQQQSKIQVEARSDDDGKADKASAVADKPDEQSSSQKAIVNAVSQVTSEGLENRRDLTDMFIADSSFSVGKSPIPNGTVATEKNPGAGGLGDGIPKSEKSEDMFCDDIFGESPAGVPKSGKGDGLHVERSGLHDNWDDAEGYYSYRFGELLDGRYEVIAAHGKGVFSTVVRAKDLKAGKCDPEEIAIKIIRNNDTMYKAGMEELIILKKLAGADPEDKRHCVRFISSFKYRNHLCLVFESLHMNLREVLKKFGRNIGLKLTAVRAYAKQLFIALKHLRNCGVLHCDIKPDNMLVNEAKNVLKLCDFGNAMFAGKNEITPYLVSRFYRAPEIILGLPYDHPMDIWSVGCCLYELYSGKVLFPGPSNNDMLRLHMELKGSFPKKMLRKGAFTDQHFDQDLNFHATEEDPVTKKTVKRLLLNIKAKDIGSLISSSPGEDPKMLANFKDLLERIFVLDPEKRMTVSQALSHPFITGK